MDPSSFVAIAELFRIQRSNAVCSGIETNSEVANSVPVFREEGFIEESPFLVDVSLYGNENCKQIELGERYYPQPADQGHLRILNKSQFLNHVYQSFGPKKSNSILLLIENINIHLLTLYLTR
ncbi:uncharacterized protein LOC123988295 [Osmia bicornis bicornis]|uniref:uncharacterized protein LOC123988295 n=1 Tax=Osmia bicornis bicornis TaxID=1437191 RepID=UPI001EAF5309|nr:uncharacterized protein LOC123988295 [Osmia bicornis bicornis]